MSEQRIGVAVVITAFHPGGTERQMIELIRRLDRTRFDVRVACFHRQGAWLPRVEETVSETIELPLRSFGAPATVGVARQFAAWLRDRRIHVVQACDRYSNIFALPTAALAGTPARIGGRRELSPPGQTRVHRLLMRVAYRCAHRVVANSAGAAAALRREGVHPSRIALIPNGIDVGTGGPAAGRRCAPDTGCSDSGHFDSGVADRGHIVATVANLRPGKGHDVLLRAAALVLEHRPAMRFRIIGGGPLAGELMALAQSLGITHAVDFLGHCEDVPAQLATSDLYVFPSLTEAFPNGLLEGMAAGLPIVASNAPGMNELIQHGENGLLVAPADPHALADALVELAGNPVRSAALGGAAHASVQSRYSFERMVAAFERLYVDELAARGVVPRAALETAA